MPIDPVEQIANAVLYEGYILYPYRASAVKNRQRFNFGALYPAAHRKSQSGADTDTFQIECLITSETAALATVDIRVRFLHLQSREVFQLASPDMAVEKSSVDDSAAELRYEPVDSLIIDGHCHQTWQEAVERDIVISGLSLMDLAAQPTVQTFSLAASRLEESLTSAAGAILGRIIRRQQSIFGKVTVSASPAAAGLFKLHLEINNATPLAESDVADRDEMLLNTLVSTHAILRTANAEFVSLLEPSDELRSAVDACRNMGLWPVLAGKPGRHDRMLASPIILYDYPQVAPESSGDWCDGAEIDEMLALRVMTLTGDEKRAMRDVDRRARQILERTESLSDDQMLKLHGTFRGLERNRAARPSEEITP